MVDNQNPSVSKMKIKKNFITQFKAGTPKYVYFHGLRAKRNGKNPSAVLSKEYGDVKNPKIAFKLSILLVDDRYNTLFGKPFLRSEIDWAEEYQKHLAGPNANTPFSPTSGKSHCQCVQCFYRDAPPKSNPKNDCQLTSRSTKKFFGIPLNMVMPKTIGGKEVGNYCPNYLDYDAE